MAADQRRGEQSPRAGRRLQPEDRDTHGHELRFAPIAQDQLTELESGGFDAEEQAEAQRAAESLAQRGKDLEIYNDFALVGFTGPVYEIFRADLAAYGFPVVRAWVRRGLMFQYCAERGRPVTLTDEERIYVMSATENARDDRQELAVETVARALEFFHRHVMLKGRWSFEGGATIKTYFVGACVYAFPNVFNRWNGERRRWRPVTDGLDPTLAEQRWRPLDPRLADDPADIVADRQTVLNELRELPPHVRDAVTPVVLGDRTFADVAEQLGITERAVEGRLYRYRTEVARRQAQRRVQ
jgi:DNA-directed RNA polymerase specialized sigma24 family protein